MDKIVRWTRGRGGGGFSGIWCAHKLLEQFSTLYTSKIEKFFDILTIHDEEISYAKHVSDPFCVIFALFGCWGGGHPRGPGHNLLMQFSSLCSSKMEISGTDFFYILTIQNDQILYVKHVFDPLYVFFTLFGGFFWGGPKGADAVFQPLQLKNGNF